MRVISISNSADCSSISKMMRNRNSTGSVFASKLADTSTHCRLPFWEPCGNTTSVSTVSRSSSANQKSQNMNIIDKHTLVKAYILYMIICIAH